MRIAFVIESGCVAPTQTDVDQWKESIGAGTVIVIGVGELTFDAAEEIFDEVRTQLLVRAKN